MKNLRKLKSITSTQQQVEDNFNRTSKELDSNCKAFEIYLDTINSKDNNTNKYHDEESRIPKILNTIQVFLLLNFIMISITLSFIYHIK